MATKASSIAGIYFRKAVTQLNKEIEKSLSGGRKGAMPKKIFIPEAKDAYENYSGKCAYCGRSLCPDGGTGTAVLYFSLYLPLESGGKVEALNVVPCCGDCKSRYRPRKSPRGEIPDVNTFADLTEKLIEAVIDSTPRDVRRIIKHEMNRLLEQIAANLPYNPFNDWVPEELIVFKEDTNTIPDVIEEMVEAEDKTSTKEAVTESVKQVLTSKQYKIVRKQPS